MIKVGMIIADRYEIQEKIGTGGMADVYRALDQKLGRPVAIKVLKQEFSENENFVSKFRSEAQAAAGLQHPNIVNVYDVGNEDGIYYIVMELVDGITLKQYIEKKSRLTVREAVSITIQVAMGLDAAHSHHIIHRDIKPQNVIISKDGKVKMTDFGIAKAASSNTITSNVMGSVHYTSPEQARGGYSDEKSDIYSLGISLFEMLTGRVPFNGDTTVAIAIKHIQEPMPSPRDFVPDLPISVEKIVMKCCQKSPDRRYQSANALITDLKQSLITPDDDFVQLKDPDEEGQTRVASEDEQQMVKRSTTGTLSEAESLRLNRDIQTEEENRRRRREEMDRRSDSEPEEEDDFEEEQYDYRKDYSQSSSGTGKKSSGKKNKNNSKNSSSKKRNDRYEDDYDRDENSMEKLTVSIAIIAALIIGAIILYLVARGTGIISGSDSGTENSAATETSTQEEDGILVPDMTGKTIAEARSGLQDKGFQVTVRNENTSTQSKGLVVISQDPEGGSRAEAGTTITLIVGIAGEDDTTTEDGEETEVTVPDVSGMDEEEATLTLIENGLSLGSVVEVSNEEVEAGLICNQTPAAGTTATAGTEVSLELSTGPEVVSYRYSANIEAPQATEEGGSAYTSGTTVHVALISSDGTTLLNTTTSNFPLSVNYTGIKSSTGVLKMVYEATTPSVTDPETGAVTAGTTSTYTVTRTITFDKE